MKSSAVCLAVFLAGTPLLAQGRSDAAPLSAIDWLSQSVQSQPPFEPASVDDATPPSVTVTVLGHLSKDPVGLLAPQVTGLPSDLWAASEEQVLVDLVRAERLTTVPALRDYFKILLLAKAVPPFDAGPDAALFLARVDKLLDLAALAPAQSMIELAKPDTGPLFRRWFDIALLTGTEDTVCDAMQNTPAIAPTYAARIFCLARSGDWATAALTLNTHRVLGDISLKEEALLSRFLDPELYEGEPPLAPPARVTPLTFRMHAAVGEPLITSNLPPAFSYADLRATAAWKSQLEATERLARLGAISENELLRYYTAHTPAASGGIWDRVAAVQRFDAAMTVNDSVQIAQTLPDAWGAMQQIRAELPFAKLYSAALQDQPLAGEAARIAFKIGLLSPDFERVATTAQNAGAGFDPFLIGIARGTVKDVAADTPRALAIQKAFDSSPPPAELQELVDAGKLGEALLRALVLFEDGYQGDLRSVTDALALLRSVGLEDLSRRAALQMMILDRGQ